MNCNFRLKTGLARNDTYQYVPIFETLQKLLSHDDVFSYIMNKHKSTDGIMRDFF